MRSAEYAALGRYLNELVGREPDWAPPIEAVHHVSTGPGYDTISVVFSANHRDDNTIVRWSDGTDGEPGFFTEFATADSVDPQVVAQRMRNDIMVFAVFSYRNNAYPKRRPRGVLDGDEQFDFRCDGEFGEPKFFFMESSVKRVLMHFAEHVSQYAKDCLD